MIKELEKKLKFDINDNNFMEKIYRNDAINSMSKKKKQFYHEIANEYQLKSTIAKKYLGLIKC